MRILTTTCSSPRVCLNALLLFAVLAACNVFSQPTESTNFSREAMLRDIAGNVLATGWQEISASCRDLTNSLNQFVNSPNPQTLQKAREAWLVAAQASARMRCFQSGPVADRDWTSTFNHWKVLPDRIQEFLRSPGTNVDQALLDNFGSETKGLFTIEYLLFQQDSHAPTNSARILAELAGPNADKTRSYLLALGQELACQATSIADDWRKPDASGAAPKFVKGGQQSVNLLVNQLAACLEDVSEDHLHLVLVLPNPISRQLARVERSHSRTSLEGVLATLEGAQRLFLGGSGLGLRDAIKQVNPALEKRIADQFDTAINSLRALDAPLEQIVVNNRAALENAYQKARALEVLIKVDVVSALGVTLTFSSNDGD